MWLDIAAQIGSGALFLLKIRPKKVYKQRLLRFMQWLPNRDSMISDVWDANMKHVKGWYKEIVRENGGGCASARINTTACRARLNSTRNRVAGGCKDRRIRGENCHGAEKVRAFGPRFGSVAARGVLF